MVRNIEMMMMMMMMMMKDKLTGPWGCWLPRKRRYRWRRFDCGAGRLWSSLASRGRDHRPWCARFRCRWESCTGNQHISWLPCYTLHSIPFHSIPFHSIPSFSWFDWGFLCLVGSGLVRFWLRELWTEDFLAPLHYWMHFIQSLLIIFLYNLKKKKN